MWVVFISDYFTKDKTGVKVNLKSIAKSRKGKIYLKVPIWDFGKTYLG